jgi:large subunit ribosomal protein L22
MPEVTTRLRYLRAAPRKVRLLADLVRGMPLKEAKLQLEYENKNASLPLLKLLNSAESNATHNFKLDPEGLYIKEIRVDGGPVLKRYMPRARGRATPIRKKTSHVVVVLEGKEVIKDKKDKK